MSVNTTSAAELDTPIISGLGWRSGASGDYDIGTWRGRPLDVRTIFIGHKTWEEMFTKSAGNYFKTNCNKTPTCVVSLAMFPDNVVGQFEACAAGSFDDNYRRLAQNIAKARSTGVAIRVGWEANGPEDRAYYIRDVNDAAPFKACFRRMVNILREVNPAFLIDWSNAKRGSLSFNVMDTYPGDDVVDIISVHYYDSGPRKSTQRIWDDYANRTYRGGPWGINTWLAEAKKRGKKLGVPEWGVWRNDETASPDNPVYIVNMYRFFALNAADIAYETYHNMGGAHQLYPSTEFPLAGAKYQRRW